MTTLLRTVALAAAVGAGMGAGPAHPVSPEPPVEVLDLTPAELPGRSEPIAEAAEDASGAFFATADYLLWRPRIDSSDFALLDPRADLTPQGCLESLSYGVRSGVRVGAGYRLPGHGWDVGVAYTYLRATGRAERVAPPGGLLYPTLTRPGLTDTALSAAANAGLNYQLFDIDFGRRVEVDPYLTLRLFGGVRIANVELDFGAVYDGGLARRADVRTRTGLDGAGPTAGAEAHWQLGRGLALFGGVRGGLVYADFDGSVRETNAGVLQADLSDRFSGLAPFATVALGGSWTVRGFTLAAGYEATHWFNLTTRPVAVDDFAEGKVLRRRGDLSLDGIFVRVGLEF